MGSSGVDDRKSSTSNADFHSNVTTDVEDFRSSIPLEHMQYCHKCALTNFQMWYYIHSWRYSRYRY